MRLLVGGKALLLAAVAVLIESSTPSGAVQSMSQSWFRTKVAKLQNKFRWMKPRKSVPLAELTSLGSLSDFVTRMNFAGFHGPRTAEELLGIFESLKGCFRNFAPPPGLALDFRSDSTMTPDEQISSFFTFVPPTKFIHDPHLTHIFEAQTSFADISTDDTAPVVEAVTPDAQADMQIQPLRMVKFSRDAKHILATIIRSVYSHFRSPSCQQAAKRLDGIRRFILRNNSKAATMEPLLIFSLVQGNVASAGKFPSHSSTTGELGEDLSARITTFQLPPNISSTPGVYDPTLLLAYFDLAKASETPPMKRLEKMLSKPHDELLVGAKLFGNSLSNPLAHENITTIGTAVGTNEEVLQKVVERLGHMAMDSSEAASILMPNLPKVASFVRGISFFAFEGVFKQHGPYVMPGLPCGGNIMGNMLETVTAKKLGNSYYVYKYTQPVSASHLPSNVWTPDADSDVAQYLKKHNQENGAYLLSHIPRVCVRTALYDKCSKRIPGKIETTEEMLCHFIHMHEAMFFKVEGKGVHAMRKNMQNTLPRGGLLARSRRALARGMRSIRRFLFSKTSVALVLGASVGGICAAAGLAGVFGGSLCAVGALGAAGLFRTLFAVAPFGVKPPIPLSLGTFLSTDFERHLQLTVRMLDLPTAQAPELPAPEAQEATSL